MGRSRRGVRQQEQGVARYRVPVAGVGVRLAVAFAICLGCFQPEVAAAVEGEAASLYRWLDSHGSIRYATDLNHIPSSRRDTVVKVVRGSGPTWTVLPEAQSPTKIPTPPTPGGMISPSATPAPIDGEIGSDPFNAPAEKRQVTTAMTPSAERSGVASWPELDARIAELEALIAEDEEIIKDMVSAPPSEDYDDVIHSTQLREVAARLPVLQGELKELRRWREQPDEP